MLSLLAMILSSSTLMGSPPPAGVELGPKAQPRELQSASPYLGFRPELAPQEPPIEVKLGLKALPGGGYFYRGTKSERFDAHIFPNGRVQFHQPGSFQVQLDNVCVGVFCPKAAANPGSSSKPLTKKDMVRREAKRIATQVALGMLAGALPSAGRNANATSFPGNYNPHNINPTARPSAPAMGLFYASGRFGYLPHLSQPKIDFLKKTEDFRLGLAVKARKTSLRKALARLQHSLRAIENHAARSPAQQRRRLLDLWAEFDLESEDAQIQERFAQSLSSSLRTKIQFARKQMRSFAQRVFPPGGSRQFSAAELAQFNETRKGDTRFDPYGPAKP